MKIFLVVAFISTLGFVAFWYLRGGKRPDQARSNTSIYDYGFTSIEGTPVALSAFRGKYMLIVNVASQCGFTPQYAELEQLAKTYPDKLVVIGFPANDFLGQEPGTNEEIKSFCTVRFGVTFPLSQKVSVTGDEQSDVFRWLSHRELNGWNDKAPKWNFYKYLVTPGGELAGVFPSSTTPMSEEITGAIK